ncbi:hypothetical protein FD754_015812, partial [Muntiacus muntjak]
MCLSGYLFLLLSSRRRGAETAPQNTKIFRNSVRKMMKKEIYMNPSLEGEFLTTEPPRKSFKSFKAIQRHYSQPAFCLEPELAGSCKNKTARYFYNAKTGYCEPFVYSGCEGSKNNFNTIEGCLKSCCP